MTAMEKKDKNLNVPNLRFPEFSGEWELVRLGDVCKFFSGGTPSSTNKDFYGGDIPFIRSGEIHCSSTELYISEAGLNSSSAKIIEQGDLLLALYGATSGDIAISKIKGAINQAILCIRTNHDNFFLKSCWEKHCRKLLQTYLQGGQGNLSADIVKSIKMSFPSCLEQKKISGFLALIEERITTQKKIIEDLKKLKDAINNSLHNNINEFQLFSFNELGNDYSGLTGKSSDDFGSGLPYISYLNVFRNDIVTDGPFDYVKVAKSEKQNIVSYGDLLFTLSSETPNEVGIGAIYLGKTNPLYLNSFCFGVHLSNQENILGPYLAYFVTSQYFRKTILPFAQGSTRYNLMKSDFMKHKFRFPNMATQKAIYNALHTLSEKIQNEEVCLNKYTEQKQYLLTRLFI